MLEWLSKRVREDLYLDTNIHISGNSELIIDCCERVAECNEVYMRLISGAMCINIRGSDLRAYDFQTGGLVIRGHIDQLEFTERSSRNEHKNTQVRQDQCQGKKTV